MTLSVVFLVLALLGAAYTVNAHRPIHRPATLAAFSFFAGWLTAELALHHVALQIVGVALLAWAGALDAWPGWAGLGVALASWTGLVACYLGGRAAGPAVEAALREGLGDGYLERVRPERLWHRPGKADLRRILLPFPIRTGEVEVIRGIPFARAGRVDLRLDLFRHESRPAGCPVLLFVHGGGWAIGHKDKQGLPLMCALAARGWVCATVDYRLSPAATFPDHIVDVKRGLEWIRERGAEFGADPAFVVVSGNSAGGHLAALAALTPGDPAFQPGFEAADTAVSGCVSFYGVYDLADRDRSWRNRGMARLLEHVVMKTSRTANPAAYERASPIARVGPHAPPFMIVHGDRDNMVPVEGARRFAAALRAVSRNPVVYAEIRGAQHAFEIFPSLRSELALGGVERFLAWLAAGRSDPATPAPVRTPQAPPGAPI